MWLNAIRRILVRLELASDDSAAKRCDDCIILSVPDVPWCDAG